LARWCFQAGQPDLVPIAPDAEISIPKANSSREPRLASGRPLIGGVNRDRQIRGDVLHGQPPGRGRDRLNRCGGIRRRPGGATTSGRHHGSPDSGRPNRLARWPRSSTATQTPRSRSFVRLLIAFPPPNPPALLTGGVSRPQLHTWAGRRVRLKKIPLTSHKHCHPGSVQRPHHRSGPAPKAPRGARQAPRRRLSPSRPPQRGSWPVDRPARGCWWPKGGGVDPPGPSPWSAGLAVNAAGRTARARSGRSPPASSTSLPGGSWPRTPPSPWPGVPVSPSPAASSSAPGRPPRVRSAPRSRSTPPTSPPACGGPRPRSPRPSDPARRSPPSGDDEPDF